MYRANIKKYGFIVIKNMFSKDQLYHCRDAILKYTKDHPSKLLLCDKGISITNFVDIQDLVCVANLKDSRELQSVLTEVFNGNNYRYCHHNDIGINRIVGWHKDKLNGVYSKYETVNIWSTVNNEEHEIYKVLIYLQDSNEELGPKLVPGSHSTSKVDLKKQTSVNLELGDVLIFDQRITHRGMERQTDTKRILVCFGFGKNNIFTDNFEKGTIERQNKQDKRIQ